MTSARHTVHTRAEDVDGYTHAHPAHGLAGERARVGKEACVGATLDSRGERERERERCSA